MGIFYYLMVDIHLNAMMFNEMFPSLVSLVPACSSHTVITPYLNPLPSHFSHSEVFFSVSPPIISGVMLVVAVSSGDQRLIRLQQKVVELRSAVDGRLREAEVKVRDGATGSSNTDLSRISDCLGLKKLCGPMCNDF